MTTLSPEARASLIAESFEGQTFSEQGEAKEWLTRKIEGAIRDAMNQAWITDAPGSSFPMPKHIILQEIEEGPDRSRG